MKKNGLFIILIFLCLSSTFALAKNYDVKVEGYIRNFIIKTDEGILSLEKAPVIIEGRSYLPLRDLAKALNYQVTWHQDTETIILEKPKLQEILPTTNPYLGEYFVYGEIEKIDFEEVSIHIEQHLDDDSKEVFDPLYLDERAILILQRNSHFMEIDFEDLRVGDVVGLVLTKDNKIRGIIVDG